MQWPNKNFPLFFRSMNLIAFNGFWYGLLLVAGGILPLWLCWVVLGYSVFHFLATPYGNLERGLIVGVFGLALLSELLSQYFHVIHYTDPGVFAGLPFWVLMMWLNFSCSLMHSWWPWLKKWWAGLIVGALAITFPYLGAAKAGILIVEKLWILAAFWLLYGVFLSYLLGLCFEKKNRRLAQEKGMS